MEESSVAREKFQSGSRPLYGETVVDDRLADDPLTELARSAQAGDRVALSDLVRATQADVWRVCAHLADRVQADDLTQEVYLRALRALPTFRAESSARTWLLGIARHVAIDSVRSSV